MIKLLTSLALALAASYGCAAPATELSTTVTFSFEGSEDGLVYARVAALEWNQVCGYNVVITEEPGFIPMREVKLRSPELKDGATWAQGMTTFGRMSPPGDVKEIDFALSPNDDVALWSVMAIAHEIGHAVNGPEHSQDSMDIMYFTHRVPSHVRPEDCR